VQEQLLFHLQLEGTFFNAESFTTQYLNGGNFVAAIATQAG
jgi:hypothetical protein